VNPSSGNLHPTEGYLLRGGLVQHYAAREHAVETRAELGAPAWNAFAAGRDGFLVGLTSIAWREAWKYGERAFRYCLHDTGHAIGTLRFAAAMLGWRLALLPRWSDSQIAAVLGVDRAGDYDTAEPEEPECIVIVTPGDVQPWIEADPSALVDAARDASWQGRANALSSGRVPWPIVDAAARVTRRESGTPGDGPALDGVLPSDAAATAGGEREPLARAIILQRRSAVAFDGRSALPRGRFMTMLRRLAPAAPPFDAIDWPPHVHLLVFVHRVDGLTPGLYAWLRDDRTAAEWRSVMRGEFLWEEIADTSGRLFLLVPTDVGWIASRLSCDQDIASDGFFSLGMIARFAPALRERGDWFYRRLFWEAGLIGQVLYLEGEAAGARATGIGCFYDDPVHTMAGLSGHDWQSLYHFSMGVPVDDDRLTTEPGYQWEK
jgi:nitroreductase